MGSTRRCTSRLSLPRLPQFSLIAHRARPRTPLRETSVTAGAMPVVAALTPQVGLAPPVNALAVRGVFELAACSLRRASVSVHHRAERRAQPPECRPAGSRNDGAACCPGATERSGVNGRHADHVRRTNSSGTDVRRWAAALPLGARTRPGGLVGAVFVLVIFISEELGFHTVDGSGHRRHVA